MTSQVLDLSHALRPGMRTHPGLPEPEWEPFRTRQEHEQASGTTFQIDRIRMVGNTWTLLDSPHHGYADGADLAGISLSQVVDVPVVVVVDARELRAVGRGLLSRALGDEDTAGAAVLLHTAGDRAWGQDSYAVDAPPHHRVTPGRAGAPSFDSDPRQRPGTDDRDRT